MSASGGKNCSISSFLSMSCREKAEVFARHLQSRLSSLNRNGDISTVNENSWLGSQDSSTTVSHQPRQSIELNLDLNGVFFESPGSPEEENGDPTIVKNNDSLNVKPILNGFKAPEFQNGHSEEPYDVIKIEENNDTPSNLHNDRSNNLQSSKSNSLILFETSCDLLPNDESTNHSQESLTINEFTNEKNSLNENTATLNIIKDDTCTYFPNPEAQYANQKIVVEESEDVTDCNVNGSLSNSNGENSSISSSKIEEVLGINDQEEIFLQPKNLLSVPFKINDEGDDEIDIEQVIPRVRRCSSLKTGKTPPGTPRIKKIVHFADVLGLELTCVRSFLDEVPKVPNSAFNDLRIDLNNPTQPCTFSNSNSSFSGSFKPERILCAMFQQPGGQPNFLDMIKERNVCLENAFVDDPIDLAIKGTIRVRNLDFNKSVHVRYSLDSWKTFADLQATYIENSCDGFSDKFSFMIFAHTLTLGQSLEFAIRFHCKGSQYWDSNYGINYIFQCLPASKQQFDHLSIENYGENWDPKFYYQNKNMVINLPVSLHSELLEKINEKVDLLKENNLKSDYIEDDPSVIYKRRNININMMQRGRFDAVTVVVIVLISIFYLYFQSNIF